MNYRIEIINRNNQNAVEFVVFQHNTNEIDARSFAVRVCVSQFPNRPEIVYRVRPF